MLQVPEKSLQVVVGQVLITVLECLLFVLMFFLFAFVGALTKPTKTR